MTGNVFVMQGNLVKNGINFARIGSSVDVVLAVTIGETAASLLPSGGLSAFFGEGRRRP